MLFLATLLTAPTLLVSAIFAGPESGSDFISVQNVENVDSYESNFATAPTALLPVEDLLAMPVITTQNTTQLDRDLASSEHPMIPLPSSAWVGIVLLAGVTVYVTRQQRTVRFH